MANIDIAIVRRGARIIENRCADGIAATHPPESAEAVVSSLRAGRQLSAAFRLLGEPEEAPGVEILDRAILRTFSGQVVTSSP